MSEIFDEFPADESHKQLVAGPVYVCSLLDKNAKRCPLVRVHAVLHAGGMLTISEDAGSGSLKTIDLEEAKVTQSDLAVLQSFQRRQFATKPHVFLVDLLHADQTGRFPTLPGLGLVFATENGEWTRLLTMAGTVEARDKKRARAKRWMRRLWRRVSGGLADSLSKDDSSSFASVEDSTSQPEEEEEEEDPGSQRRGFSSFQEYLAAPMAERQRRPPTVAEFSSVLEFVDAVTETSPGWSVCTDKEDVFALKSLDIDTGVIRVKTRGLLQNVPPEIVFLAVFDPEIRASWDKHFRFFKTVSVPEEVAGESPLDVIHACVNSPLGCADREFLEWRMQRGRGREFEIYLRSCDWDGAPETGKGRVRSDVIASAYIVKPATGLDTEIVIYSQVDIKGSVPKTIINSLAPSAPLRWIRKLRSACADLMGKRSISSTSSVHELDRLVAASIATAHQS